MLVHVVKSKIHRIKVTGADLNYIGSITIDENLMDAANIVQGEKVQIVNNNNGERLETYAIPGPRNSGEITLNGAAARKVAPGDVLILITYAMMDIQEAKDFAKDSNSAVETTYLRFKGTNILKTNHSMFLTSILAKAKRFLARL